jgi:hypothetical protein
MHITHCSTLRHMRLSGLPGSGRTIHGFTISAPTLKARHEGRPHASMNLTSQYTAAVTITSRAGGAHALRTPNE